jgi:hypothetical protein
MPRHDEMATTMMGSKAVGDIALKTKKNVKKKKQERNLCKTLQFAVIH